MTHIIFSSFPCNNTLFGSLKDDIEVNLQKLITHVISSFKKTDKHDRQVATHAILNLVKQRILNGETLYIYAQRDQSLLDNYVTMALTDLVKFSRKLKRHIIFLPSDKSDLLASRATEYETVLYDIDSENTQAYLKQTLSTDVVSLDHYKEIVRIGDVQGCLDTLKRALPHGIEDDRFYVFLGDYIDRGPDSIGVLRWLLKHCFDGAHLKKNVVLLMGNHERHLQTWRIDMKTTSKSFRTSTKPFLCELTLHDIDRFIQSLRPSFVYQFRGHTTICCHGGFDTEFPAVPDGFEGGIFQNMWLLSDKECYGGYISKLINPGEAFIQGDVIKRDVSEPKKPLIELVYGHFHMMDTPLSWQNDSLNLRSICHENKVDRGGHLVVSIDKGDRFEMKQF